MGGQLLVMPLAYILTEFVHFCWYLQTYIWFNYAGKKEQRAFRRNGTGMILGKADIIGRALGRTYVFTLNCALF